MRRRPDPLPLGFTPPQALRFRRGKGRRYVPDVVDRVRVLAEGTALSDAAIATRTGVGTTTVHTWTKRHGWRRPAEASRSTRKVARLRAGFARRLREGLRRVAALAEREVARLAATDHADDDASVRARTLVAAALRAAEPSRTGAGRSDDVA